jgi:cytochrome c-type biogenesis protein CcmH/NrfF
MADPKKERTFQIINILAVLTASVLLGVVAMQAYMGRTAKDAAAPAQAPSPSTTQAVPPQASKPVFEQDITVPLPQAPVELSQRAKILATEFYCLCKDNCNMVLLDCQCLDNPGQREMKQFLQALVDQEKKSEEIREAMVAKYGPSVKIQ